jgi:hypothetical protein
MLQGVLQRVGRAAALQLAGGMPEHTAAWATKALAQQFAEMASAAEGRGSKMSRGGSGHGGQPCDTAGCSSGESKSAASVVGAAGANSCGHATGSSSGSSGKARAAASSSSSSSSRNHSSNSSSSSSSYFKTTANPTPTSSTTPSTVSSSVSKSSSYHAQPAILADALQSPSAAAAAAGAASAAAGAAAAAKQPAAPTTSGGAEVALLQLPAGLPPPSTVTDRTLPLVPSTVAHFRMVSINSAGC